MAQKAVEMGAGRLRPVVTRRTQVARLNLERLEANAIEASEQCGAVWIPKVLPPEPLDRALAAWPAERLLVFCDEGAPPGDPLDALRRAEADQGVGLLIGPEGGFDEAERAAILGRRAVLRLSLGPRVLGPTPRRSPHWRSSRRLSATGETRHFRARGGDDADAAKRHFAATMSAHLGPRQPEASRNAAKVRTVGEQARSRRQRPF